MSVPVGLLLGSGTPPELLAPMSALGEELGFSELWISEDCFYTGGISGAAIALSATSRIQVGLGLVSAVVRHPAVLAMECATLARAFPGRFRPGIGLGLAHGLHQLELYPKSQLAAVRESIGAVRALLAGESVEQAGEAASFRGVSLAYPLSEPVAIYMGGHGPRMLRLAGEIADGLLLSIFAGEAYVRWARELALEGRVAARRGGGPGSHGRLRALRRGRRLGSREGDACADRGVVSRRDAAHITRRRLRHHRRARRARGWRSQRDPGGYARGVVDGSLRRRGSGRVCRADPPPVRRRRRFRRGLPVPAGRTDEALRLTAAEVFPRL